MFANWFFQKAELFCPLPAWQLGPSCTWRPKQRVRRSSLKSPPWLTTLPSSLPPGNPTGVDKHHLEFRKEQPSFQKTCTGARSRWKPLHTVLEGWGHGLLQTDCGVQKGETEDLGCQAQAHSWPPAPVQGRGEPGGGRFVSAAPLHSGTRGRTAGLSQKFRRRASASPTMRTFSR